jgi:hypothetical protein
MLLPLALVGSLTLAPGGNRPSDSIPKPALFQPTLESVAITMPRVVAPSGGAPLSNVALSNPAATSAEPDPSSPQVIEYSDAYYTRLEIHKWVSIAMIPLFAGEWVVGEKMYRGDSSRSLRHAHQWMAVGISGLFVVNTVTGLWNLIAARHDPYGRTRRTIHGALMLLADAGFVATSLTGHRNRTGAQKGFVFQGVRNLAPHRNLAIASMATTLVSIAIMIPPFRKD